MKGFSCLRVPPCNINICPQFLPLAAFRLGGAVPKAERVREPYEAVTTLNVVNTVNYGQIREDFTIHHMQLAHCLSIYIRNLD